MKPRLDLAAVRARLAAARGPAYWRCLEELCADEGFAELVQREFPRHARVTFDALGRRDFLKLMGAALALAGLAGCTGAPEGKLVPYVRAPEEIVPGQPQFFATAVSLGGYGIGLLAESHMGRPTKLEGNPDHPASLGATDAFAQAAILELYDPDRAQAVTNLGRIRTWEQFSQDLRAALETQRASQGAGLRLLTETVTSPALAAQLRDVLARFPAAKWQTVAPLARDNAREGARLAFGAPVETTYRFERAAVIVTLDADFLSYDPGRVRYARDFTARRRVPEDAPPTALPPDMNRLYAVESTLTLTGAKADHRLALRAGDIPAFAGALAAALGVPGWAGVPAPATVPPAWIPALARDLQAHPGAGLVIAGDGQPPAVHALAHAMNAALGNAGQTVVYIDPVAAGPGVGLEAGPADSVAALRELAEDLGAGRVQVLLILGGNPAFTAPVDLSLGDHLPKVPFGAHLGLYDDETSALCQWHIPEAHFLEAWSDVRAYDGTVAIVQPLIAPLYGGKSAHELLAVLGDSPEATGYDLVRGYWQSQHPEDFERFWREALHAGVVPDSALPPKAVALVPDWAARVAAAVPAPPEEGTLELVFRADASAYDGRFANNGWLQELPRPLTKLTWDNAALVSPATAARLGVASEDVVELRYGGRVLAAPVWVLPGQADGSVTLPLGYGRTRAGQAGTGVGFNAYALRTASAPWFDRGLQLVKTGARHALASTQRHQLMEGRDLVHAATLAEYERDPYFKAERDPAREAEEQGVPGDSLYPPQAYPGESWGMAIDLSACMGCNACVAACQAENNIPIVGQEQVLNEREMHWLRIDTYFRGALDAPEVYFEPVPCMQCENAPCEPVCPVGATVHSADALNDMVYNRCVGTRYCSNNCPYKVRRFNFLQFADFDTETLKLLRNPDVTVRERGVMEKCTYCVQRIRGAQAAAVRESRALRDGDVQTACQAVCPAQAITFGNLNDPGSRVAKLKAQARNYALLAELGTRPHTTYLAALRNPNEEIGSGEQGGGSGRESGIGNRES